MRIAFLTNGLFPWRIGGIQKHTCNLAREWAMSGVGVDLLFADDPVYPPDQDILDAVFGGPSVSVRLLRYPARRARGIPLHHYLECYWDSVEADRILHTIPPADFVYVQAYQGLAQLRNKRKGTVYPPIGVNLHGVHAWQTSWFSWREALRKVVTRPMERFMLRSCDVALSLGGRIDQIISRVSPRTPILRSANGIAAEWIARCPSPANDRVRFVFVGRHETAKGLGLLLSAFRALGPVGNRELHIVSPLPPELQRAEPQVTYHGAIRGESAMRALLRTMDVLVNPSLTEGLPTVVLEGMASGLGIIATDVGATTEVVGPDNGWLVAPNNVRQLRDSLREASALPPPALQQMKATSLAKVVTFQWPRVALSTLRAIQDFVRSSHWQPQGGR